MDHAIGFHAFLFELGSASGEQRGAQRHGGVTALRSRSPRAGPDLCQTPQLVRRPSPHRCSLPSLGWRSLALLALGTLHPTLLVTLNPVPP